MNVSTYRSLGDVVLIAGLLLFVAGAVALALGYPLDAPVAAFGALALLFVGVGSAMKKRTPGTT